MTEKKKLSSRQKLIYMSMIALSLFLIYVVASYVLTIDVNKMNNDAYIRELQEKYPTIEELKIAVRSGELDYDELPEEVKNVYDFVFEGLSEFDKDG